MAAFVETFRQAELELDLAVPAYTITLASSRGGVLPAYFGCGLQTVAFAETEDIEIDTLIIGGGLGFRQALLDQDAMDWISRRAPSARRLCMTASGTFLVAQAGLLDGRRCVTHWTMYEEFRRTYPKVQVERDLLFVRDREMWSAAGMSAVVDLTIDLLAEDLGRKLARVVSKRLVMLVKRSGNQPQVSAALTTQPIEEGRFELLHEWMLAHLGGNLHVNELADRVSMSVRNFTRVYTKLIGVNPSHAVEMMRVEAAKAAILDSDLRLSTISQMYGFGGEQVMRRAFTRQTGHTPSELREEKARRSR